MKRIISISIFALFIALAGCESRFGDGVKLKGIQVEETFRIGINQTGRAKAFPIPWDCTDYEFTWTSSDESVVTVNRFGMVTAVAERAATCYLTVSSGSFSERINVEVFQKSQMELFEETNVAHLFLFENESNPFQATIGADLQPVPATGHDPFQIVPGYNAGKKALRVPAARLRDDRNGVIPNGLYLNHGFDATPIGRNRVNQFTILVDIKFSPRTRTNFSWDANDELASSPLPLGPGPRQYEGGWSPGWTYSLYHTQFGADFFPDHNDVGFRWMEAGQYGIRDIVTPNQSFQRDTWYRFIISADLGVGVTYFKNGVKETHNNNANMLNFDNAARSWPVTGIVFFSHQGGGGAAPLPHNFEAHEVEIATLAIWGRALSESEMRGLIVPNPDDFGKLLVE